MLEQIIAAYQTHRTTAEPLPRGSAPCTSCSVFKLRNESGPQRFSKKWDHHLSQEGNLWSASELKASTQPNGFIDIITLGAARPVAQFYPWSSVDIEAVDAFSVDIPHDQSLVKTTCAKGETNYDLSVLLDYNFAAGSPQVIRFVTEHMEMVHNPPYADWEVALTCGTTSAIEIVLRMLCDRGDFLITDEFTYTGTLGAAAILGLNLLPIPMDQFGMIPEDLDLKLTQWTTTDGQKPRVLYLVPTGQNPTATTQPNERRHAIYSIAEKHDLIIFEDDPYYFIQLQSCGPHNGHANGDTNDNINGDHYSLTPEDSFLYNLPPSYLSLDTSSRVLRMDSTSKTLSPGLRCGWITGAPSLIRKYLSVTDLSTVSPSGPSQMMLYKLLDESWGHAGFFKWLMHLSRQYSHRARLLLGACERFLPQPVCRWTVPEAGMFLWIRITPPQREATANDEINSERSRKTALDLEDKIYQRANGNGVLVTKGSWFIADPQAYTQVYIRLTFAAADEGDLDRAVERFGRAVREEVGLCG